MESELNVKHIKGLARWLSNDIVDYVVQKKKGNCPNLADYYAKNMRLAVDQLLEIYHLQFVNIAEKLSKSDSICDSFVACADELFMDKQYNWGRVFTLYAFAACLADVYAAKDDGHDLMRKLGETLANFVSDNLTDWIRSQGGWVSYLYTTRV